jgi:hypothetical protein
VAVLEVRVLDAFVDFKSWLVAIVAFISAEYWGIELICDAET